MEHRQTTKPPLYLVHISAGATETVTGGAAPKVETQLEHFLVDSEGELRPVSEVEARAQQGRSDFAFLLEWAGMTPILVTASSTRPIPSGEGGADLLARATEGAQRWQQEHMRTRWRCQLADHLIEFSRVLNQAVETPQVYEALTEHVVRMLGGFTVLIFVRDRMTGIYHALENPRINAELWKLALPEKEGLLRPGTIQYDDTREDIAAPFVELAPLFEDRSIVSAAHFPFAGDHLLFLLERRQGRALDPEEWKFLGALLAHAETALKRIRLFAEIRSLSLTDSLTGLANRRQMKLVLERSFATARRGQPLTLVLLDLDRFKQINDEYGHLMGDQVLCHVASTLRGLVRGSDLVIRYGGDEFLLVLPDSNEAGALALVARIRENLGEIGISAGIAEYKASIQSVQELIDRADQSLLEAKQKRGASVESPLPRPPVPDPPLPTT